MPESLPSLTSARTKTPCGRFAVIPLLPSLNELGLAQSQRQLLALLLVSFALDEFAVRLVDRHIQLQQLGVGCLWTRTGGINGKRRSVPDRDLFLARRHNPPQGRIARLIDLIADGNQRREAGFDDVI